VECQSTEEKDWSERRSLGGIAWRKSKETSGGASTRQKYIVAKKTDEKRRRGKGGRCKGRPGTPLYENQSSGIKKNGRGGRLTGHHFSSALM